MQVSDILEKKGERVVSVDGSVSLSAVASTLSLEGIGALLIQADGNGLAGIISERDIVRSLAERGPSVLDLPASQFMSPSLVTCSPENSTEEIMAQMLESRIRHLPVIENGTLVGIISIGDVVKAVLSELKWLTTVLQDQIVAATGWSTDED